jgi:hypothetical protein
LVSERDIEIVSELGRGSQGVVFLAVLRTQQGLKERKTKQTQNKQ